MFDWIRLLTAAIIVAIAAPAAAATSTDIASQTEAILKCKQQRFIGGAAYIVKRKSSSTSSAMAVEILPYDQVTTVDAQNINICAAKRVGLSAAAVEQLTARSRTIVRSIRYPNGFRGQGCGKSPSILYRGDMYCQWARR